MTSNAFHNCHNISPYLSVDYINFPQSWYVSTFYKITIYDYFLYLSLNTNSETLIFNSFLLAFNMIQGLLTGNQTRATMGILSSSKLWTTEMEIRELEYFEIY